MLSIAGVRQEGFRAEKFVEILESLPRTEALEAEPEWLAEVCGAVVSLYKQPRTKVFARRDVYARHLNVLVYLPRERYSASVAHALARALQASSGATHVSSQTLVADGPLARVYLIAHAARYPLDLETDIQQPLLSVLDGWHNSFAALADAVPEVPLRANLRKLCSTLPADYVAQTAPAVAFHDLGAILRNTDPSRVDVRVEVAAESPPPSVCTPSTARRRCRPSCRRCTMPAWPSTANRRTRSAPPTASATSSPACRSTRKAPPNWRSRTWCRWRRNCSPPCSTTTPKTAA